MLSCANLLLLRQSLMSSVFTQKNFVLWTDSGVKPLNDRSNADVCLKTNNKGKLNKHLLHLLEKSSRHQLIKFFTPHMRPL